MKSTLVRKLWQYCTVLRDDGLSYPDYVEQLTYLLFLKMSDESPGGPIDSDQGWRSFADLDPFSMHKRYSVVLAELSGRKGMVGFIFQHARNKIRDPEKLHLLVRDLIGPTRWSDLSDDVKGDAYEGLLEKNARDTKSGAGQYFTPRGLIEAIVECIEPRLGETICDPACGTGGFLLAAYQYLRGSYPHMSVTQDMFLRTDTLRGSELVEDVARLAAMNFLLHGISAPCDAVLPITCEDSLVAEPRTQFDIVLTNPPFGVKGSVTYRQSDGIGKRSLERLTVPRSDFWAATANKQLNFLQHIATLLKAGGRAAVVVPDNVLFEVGAAAAVRRRLLERFDLHTLLRLPRGLFYAQGVAANVLFFDRPATRTSISSELWTYDFRTDRRYTLRTPLSRDHLGEFVSRYHAKRTRESAGDGWHVFDKGQILASKDCSLDLWWRAPALNRPASANRLDELAKEIADDLRMALSHLDQVRGE